MKVLRAAAAIALLLVLAWLVAGRGWDSPSSLQLIRVTDLAPREVEPGDRIAVIGEGFPSGKPARLTFRGALHRPGAAALKGAEVSVWGTVVAPDRVEVNFDEAAEALFCGAGDRAAHTTFEGDLEVAFASALAGAPPIAGFLGGVTLDVRPGPSADAIDRDSEAGRFLAFLGMHLTPEPRGRGLLVDAVDYNSRAQAAGIETGDVLESFDSVRVGSVRDVMAAPDERDATIKLRRVSLAEPLVRTISVVGFRPELPEGWVASALIIFGALGIVLLFAAPAPMRVSIWIQFVVGRARERLTARRARRSLRGVALVAWAEIGHEVVPSGPSMIVDAVACGLIAVLPLGQFRVAFTLDIGALFVGSATALAAASLVAGKSLLPRLRRMLHVGWQHVPPLVAVACVVLATGSLRMQEIARAQGGWPWEWLAFRSPAAPVALALLLSSMRIDFDADGRRSQGPWLQAVFRAHRIVVAGLASVLFLGAWSLPGVTFAEQDARPILQFAGLACLMAKTVVVLSAMAWSRWALTPMPLPERSQWTALWLIPAGLLAFGTTALWSFWSPRSAAQLTMTGSLLIAALLGAGAIVHRLRHGLLAGASEARLSPFL